MTKSELEERDVWSRVLAEHEELSGREWKLRVFLDTDMFRSLDESEQCRLRRQNKIMQDYCEVLKERLAWSEEGK